MTYAKQERVTCECGRWVVSYRDADGRKLANGEWVRESPGLALRVLGTYCRECHTELSFDADGLPVARRMVPKTTLDTAHWLIATLYHLALKAAPDDLGQVPNTAREVAEKIWLAEIKKATGALTQDDIGDCINGVMERFTGAQEATDND